MLKIILEYKRKPETNMSKQQEENKARFDKLRREYFDFQQKEHKKTLVVNSKRRFNELNDNTVKEDSLLDTTLKQLLDKESFNTKKNSEQSMANDLIRFTDKSQTLNAHLHPHINSFFKAIKEFEDAEDKNVQSYYIEKNEKRFEKYIKK